MIHIKIPGSYEYTRNMAYHYLWLAIVVKLVTAPNVTWWKLDKPAIIMLGSFLKELERDSILVNNYCNHKLDRKSG